MVKTVGGKEMKMPAIQTVPIDELTLDNDIDPRLTERSRERIQDYADNVDNLPPILVDANKRILDGVHRYMAHQLVGKTEIKIQSVNADTRQKALMYVAKYNSRHGVNLTPKELKKVAIELYMERATDDAIAEAISRSKATVHAYLKETKEAWKEMAMQMVAELLEAGVSQKEIARQVTERGPGKISQETVSVWKRALEKEAEEILTTPEPVAETDNNPKTEDANEIVPSVVKSIAMDVEPKDPPTPVIDNAVVPIAPKQNRTQPAQRTQTYPSSYIDDEYAVDDSEIAGYDIPDIDLDEEGEAAVALEQIDYNLFKNDTHILDSEDCGSLDDIHMDVVNAIGFKDDQLHLYCGNELKAFLGMDWEQVFVRAELCE